MYNIIKLYTQYLVSRDNGTYTIFRRYLDKRYVVRYLDYLLRSFIQIQIGGCNPVEQQ